jgi:hypothetical protein
MRDMMALEMRRASGQVASVYTDTSATCRRDLTDHCGTWWRPLVTLLVPPPAQCSQLLSWLSRMSHSTISSPGLVFMSSQHLRSSSSSPAAGALLP